MKITAEAQRGIDKALSEGRATERQGAKGRTTSAGKPSKYRNQKTNGFDSKKEAARHAVLVAMEKSKRIAHLRCQVKYPLVVNGWLVCHYVADFVYFCANRCREIVEDVKSPATRKNRAYRIKVKLMHACHGIDVQEV